MNQRRSRMHRTTCGKRFELTSRDLTIFRTLAKYRYLRSTYLHAFAGGASSTRFKERLGDLFHESYIDRPQKQWEFAGARYAPAVYELGTGGKRVLESTAGHLDEARTFPASNACRQFLHALMICECLASIELAAKERDDLRFVPWAEILAKAPETTKRASMPFRIPVGNSAVIPDGLFALEYRADGRKTYRFFALEADRGTMPVSRTNPAQTSYLAKLDAYRALLAHGLHKTHWGIPNLLVLTIAPNETRIADILRKMDGGVAFLFKAVPVEKLKFPASELLLEPWLRARSDSFRIDQER